MKKSERDGKTVPMPLFSDTPLNRRSDFFFFASDNSGGNSGNFDENCEKNKRRPQNSKLCIDFLSALKIPEGPNAGKPLKLAKFQKDFVRGALKPKVSVAVLSVGRGNGKSALSAGMALGALLGVWDRQPAREILLAARSRDQAKIAYSYALGLSESLPIEIRAKLIIRRSPRLEIEYTGDGGRHLLKAVAADGKSVLGTSPTMAILDERGHWPLEKGEALEDAILTGLGKRAGRALIISTSAADDTHPFSLWIDKPPPGTYVQEHRPPPGLPADDMESLLLANPGAKSGIGAKPVWLEAQAARAIAQGGHALSSFRLYNRNERISGEARDLLLTLDEWLDAETDTLPRRAGDVVIGIDLGGSASMSAAAFYWPETGRLEAKGWFPNAPTLLNRGERDGVGNRYCDMQDRGELDVLGDKTVPPKDWFEAIMAHVDGETVSALVADRYKQSELGEAMDATGVSFPVIWRGMGFRDGGEDVERFRRAVFDGRVSCDQSLLMRSALSDAVCLRDPAGNAKLAKARSKGRIDAVSAAVIAIAEGARQSGRTRRDSRAPVWA